jgi:hypothetical protein
VRWQTQPGTSLSKGSLWRIGELSTVSMSLVKLADTPLLYQGSDGFTA